MSRFDAHLFAKNKFVSQVPSMLGRLRNQLTNAIKLHKLLPKLIVVVLDDDLIDFLIQKNAMTSFTLEKVVHWLMKQFSRVVASYKELIPKKSVGEKYPQFVWIQCPYNINYVNNSDREKFNQVIEDTAKFFDNTGVFQLKKIWEESDTTLFLKEANRYTSDGLRTYWEAVDRTIRFCDTTMLRRIAKQELKFPAMSVKKIFNPEKERKFNNDRYKWTAKKRNQSHYRDDRNEQNSHNVGNQYSANHDDYYERTSGRQLPRPY